MKNPWRDCITDPPDQYTRVEIKSKYNRKYIGYRYKDKYFTTIGNYNILEPQLWRYIPEGSYLWNEIKEKIKGLSLGEEEPEYG